MQDYTTAKSIHFIGIAGSGMVGLAELSHALGKSVTGSDPHIKHRKDHFDSICQSIWEDHSPEHISNQDLVVYSTAIKNDNPELVAARRNKIPCLHRSEYLQTLVKSRKCIVVAGTHGKTTTTAMIFHMLQSVGIDCGFYLGGIDKRTQMSSHLGEDALFVLEADESDKSFLAFTPHISVVTNIDLDHLEVYGDLEGIKSGFSTFLKNTDPEGTVIINWDDSNLKEISEPFYEQRKAFGRTIGCDVRAYLTSYQNGETRFEILVDQTKTQGTLPMIGAHNISNLSAALAVAGSLKLDVQEAAESFAFFRGVNRRFDVLLKNENLTIIDDYAHNPGKIKNAIKAVKSAWPERTLITVFEPHRPSRLRTMYQEFLDALVLSDKVACLPLYLADEPEDPEISQQQFLADLQAIRDLPTILTGFEIQGLRDLKAICDVGAIVLIVGAGRSCEFAHMFVEYN